jgi:hypothetical protein
VGYSGLVVLVRCDRDIDQLPCIVEMVVDVDEFALGGGWRIGYLDEIGVADPAGLAGELVVATGAPAIAMFVFDSEAAWAVAAAEGRPPVLFHLNEKALAQLFVEDDRPFQSRNGSALAGLLDWAAQAGLTPDAGALARAVDMAPGTLGSGIDFLAAALGIADHRARTRNPSQGR